MSFLLTRLVLGSTPSPANQFTAVVVDGHRDAAAKEASGRVAQAELLASFASQPSVFEDLADALALLSCRLDL